MMNQPQSMQTAVHQIATWLAQQVSDNGFPARSFYGEAFALWLWQYFPGEFEAAAARLHPIALQQLNRSDAAAHPEFNAWAWFHISQKVGRPLPELPRLNNTANSNWLLLGTLVRLLWAQKSGSQTNPGRLRWHTRLLLAIQQQSDGLIRDDRLISRRLPVPFPYGRISPYRLKKMPHLQKLSLQYHCFSLALLWEIWLITGWAFVQTAVQRGHQAIGRFILANGDSLYIGRGQQQIFGYGSLIVFLAAQAQSGNLAAAEQLSRVWQFVSQFQQAAGRFPLVLCPGEDGYPKVVNTQDPRWLGWYSYNNLFDYLPFFGVQLARAAQLLPESLPKPLAATHQIPIDVTHQFAFVRQSGWQMTLAAPGGSLSQDQPMPYFCLRGESILPCFGGEEGDDQPYNLTMLPLPYLELENGRCLFLRQALRWQFSDDTHAQPILLTGTCRWASLQRFFSWEAQKIMVQDVLTLKAGRLPAGVQTVYPLVFTAFELAELEKTRFQIKPASLLIALNLDGVQGKLGSISGHTPLGPVQILREAVAWRPENNVFQRTYTLTWAEAT